VLPMLNPNDHRGLWLTLFIKHHIRFIANSKEHSAAVSAKYRETYPLEFQYMMQWVQLSLD
jgi:hypothetical protein